MELIKLLINQLKGEMCFLCYKPSVNMQSIYSTFEVKNELFDESLSLNYMILALFPSLEVMITKSCEDCVSLIITMYVIMHRNKVMKTTINNIIDSINKGIKSNITSGVKSLNININLLKGTQGQEQVLKTSQKYENFNTNDENYDDVVVNKLEEQSCSQETQCPDCFKVFASIKKFKTHMKGHKKRLNKVHYSCSHCNYRSLCKQSLQGHMNKNHLKTRPHVCTVCFKDFYHRKNLVEHSKTHSDARNEVCEVCGDRFIYKKSLLEHLKLHSGEKPYSCDVCGKRFITSGRRLEHIKRCHSEKNECCLICNKKFGLVKELRRHVKVVHS